MHLSSLQIKNFRMLEDFQVKKLGKVNLIVGKNNSGKSTVLEALRIYAGNANPVLLKEIELEHDENSSFPLHFESFFQGRGFPYKEGKEDTIFIGENNSQKFITLRPVTVLTSRTELPNGGFTEARKIEHITRIGQAGSIATVEMITNVGGKESYFNLNDPIEKPKSTFDVAAYIPTQLLSQDELAIEWGKLNSEQEKLVIEMLQIIATGVSGIKASQDIIKINLNGQYVPLRSMGEGIYRALQIAIKAILAKDGFLLIDEFENGLHYSVQEEIWNWLFELADKFNIQIFATTHSWDCVTKFAKVATQRQEGVLFRTGISVRDSNKGQVIATEFTPERLSNLTEADIDVR